MGLLVSCIVSIKDIGGENSIQECGTVKWTIEDVCRPNDLLIPGTYYNPKSPYRLLLIQHWAQTSSNPSGTMFLTTHNCLVLTNTSLAFKCTIWLDHNTNCGFVHSVPRYKNLHSFMAMFPLSQEPTCFMQHYRLITAQERAVVTDKTGSPKPDSNISADLPKGISPFDLPDKNNEEFKVMWQQEQVNEMSKYSDELLWVHYKLGHLSFAKTRFMAAVGWLDKRLSNCNIPKCAGCMYGKATRRPWRMKGVVNQILKSKAPGELVFIDQLMVSMPGNQRLTGSWENGSITCETKTAGCHK